MRGDVGLRGIAVGSRTALGGVGVCEEQGSMARDVWAAKEPVAKYRPTLEDGAATLSNSYCC